MLSLNDKKILVTGGAGFLGSRLIEHLLAHGAKKENILIPRSRECDLRRQETCERAVQGMDIVIHAAATVGGIGFNKEHPGMAFYDNAAMALNIVDASYRAGAQKFVGIGTVCSYPKFAPIPFREEDLWNGYPEETNAPYGLAKKIMLTEGQAYRQEYGFNAIHLLMVNLYGPGDNFNPESSHVIPALIKKVAEAKRANAPYMEAWGTGSPTREFLYVDDAAEAIVLATEKYDKPEPVNLGSGMEISIKELNELICRLMDYRGEIRWDPTKPDGQPRRALDVSRAEREFGFRATTSFEEGLKQTIARYQENT
jgi:GDP-L-fucose synthase